MARPRQPRDPSLDERISLHPLKGEDAVRALLATPPPSKNGKAKKKPKRTAR